MFTVFFSFVMTIPKFSSLYLDLFR